METLTKTTEKMYNKLEIEGSKVLNKNIKTLIKKNNGFVTNYLEELVLVKLVCADLGQPYIYINMIKEIKEDYLNAEEILTTTEDKLNQLTQELKEKQKRQAATYTFRSSN